MPTEHEYERAATELRSLARQLDDQALRAPGAPSAGFATSPAIAAVVDDAQMSAITLITRAADELRRMARICDDRAAACRQHAAAVRAYWATPVEIRVHLARPQPAAPWIEP